jgi:hypothetical protein
MEKWAGYFHEGLETVERGERGYAFKPVKTDIVSQVNSRKIGLKLKLTQMCQEKLEGIIVAGAASTNSQVVGWVFGRAVKYNGKDDLDAAKGG